MRKLVLDTIFHVLTTFRQNLAEPTRWHLVVWRSFLGSRVAWHVITTGQLQRLRHSLQVLRNLALNRKKETQPTGPINLELPNSFNCFFSVFLFPFLSFSCWCGAARSRNKAKTHKDRTNFIDVRLHHVTQGGGVWVGGRETDNGLPWLVYKH